MTGDTVVDKVAKILCPPGDPNWHSYRDWARTILAEAADFKTGELSAILALPDRKVTHDELVFYSAERVQQWLNKNDEPWIKAAKKAMNGDWTDLQERVDLLESRS